MKYFIIAGEASGDLHASHLMQELRVVDRQADFVYFGGDLMQTQGGVLLKHYREMAFMGLFAVILNLRKIKKNFALAEKKLLEFRPDVLILVDYPGFNLRMAAFARRHRIKVFYYISPKIWAWKTKRVYKVKKYVDELFTIFPFETDFYKKYNYPVHFVGNPTIDQLSNRPDRDEKFEVFIQRNNLSGKPIIALLAGSRRQEILRVLPVMAQASRSFPEYQFVVAGAPSQSFEIYQQALGNMNIPVIFNQTYQLLQQSAAALVTSGTATLETAVIGTPQVVCYIAEAGRIGKWVKDFLVKIPYISLVNLILNREAVKELFQLDCTPKNVTDELSRILNDKDYRKKMIDAYSEMAEKLGGPGGAHRAASEMVRLLNS